MAVALVTGQAALCVVIGWVTFGSPAGPPGRGPVDPLAAAPIVVPTVSMRLPAASPAPTPAAERTTVSPSARRASGPPEPPQPPPVEDPVATAAPSEEPSTVIAPVPATTSPTPAPDPVASTPSPSVSTHGPVVVSEPCRPEGALGRTADEQAVRCVRGDDGNLRWQII